MKKLKSAIIMLITIALLITALSSCTLPGMSGIGTNQNNNEPQLSTQYVYSLAVKGGYTGSLNDFIEEFKGEPGADGKNGAAGSDGADGVGISDVVITDDGSLLITLTNGTSIDCGKVNTTVVASATIAIGPNGNWYIDGEDTGKRAEAVDGNTWHTGDTQPASSLGINGDLYLNTTTCDVYKKISGVWSVIANIAGDVTINEGDDYNLTINNDTASDKFAAAKALMSAVTIECMFGASSIFAQKYVSSGAGVIYKMDKASGDAYVITNYHVLYDKDATTENKISDDISVYLYGMEYSEYKIAAEYVGGSMTYDIAVIKISDSEILSASAACVAEIADSRNVRVLDTAIAVGNPASLGLSVTKGSVSVESQFIEMMAPDEKSLAEYRVMRIDTAVNSGNSGGGLFDGKGRLIGIVNAKENNTELENMGYAIPINLAVYVAENVIRNCNGVENEQVIKCRIGMMIEIAESKAVYNEETGELIIEQTCAISEIETGSIAEVMLKKNDIIKSFEIDGTLYEVKYFYDGSEILLNADVDSEIFVTVEREGQTLRHRLYTTEANFTKIP